MERIVPFLDDIFQPILQSFPTFVKVLAYLLQILKWFKEQSLHNSAVHLVYSRQKFISISPNEDGFRAFERFLNEHLKKNTVLILLQIVLTPNCFSLNI